MAFASQLNHAAPVQKTALASRMDVQIILSALHQGRVLSAAVPLQQHCAGMAIAGNNANVSQAQQDVQMEAVKQVVQMWRLNAITTRFVKTMKIVAAGTAMARKQTARVALYAISNWKGVSVQRELSLRKVRGNVSHSKGEAVQ